MGIEKLFVLPTPETRDIISSRFRELPVTIHYDALGVEIGSRASGAGTKDINPVDAEVEYRALPGSMGVWYDSMSARSWIILPLIPSPEMTERRMEIGDYWGRLFVPYLALSSEFNNVRIKPRLNSLATGFIETRPILTFNCETVLVENTDRPMPSHSDFYESYVKNGGHLIPKFMDLVK